MLLVLCMEVILDSSFILSCMKRNIDFVAELAAMGFRIAVPREVMQELKDFKTKKTSRETRMIADLALEILNSKKFFRLNIKSVWILPIPIFRLLWVISH